ncbi:MAG: sensor histidine kinase [Pseudomonadota bacterium]
MGYPPHRRQLECGVPFAHGNARMNLNHVTYLCLQLRWVVLAGLLGFSVGVPAHGQTTPEELSPIELSTAADFYLSLSDFAVAYVDEDGSVSADDIIGLPDQFQPIRTPYIDFGLLEGRVWLQIEIQNPTARAGPWRIDFARQYIENLRAYIVRPGEAPVLFFENGAGAPFSAREIKSRLLTQDFNVPSGDRITLLISYTSSATTFLPAGIGTPSAVVNRHKSESSLNDFLNGGLWAVIAIALIMMPIIGWRISASFSAYILAGFFYVFHADGYTFQYLFPNIPWLNSRLNLFFMLALAACALAFVRQLFNYASHSPQFDRFIKTMMLGAAVFAVLAIPFIDVPVIMVAGYAFVPLCSLTQGVAGIVAWRKGLAGATPYLIGGALVVASFGYATIAHLVPGQFNIDKTLDFGHVVLLLECFVFAAAIMLRVLEIRTQRDQAVHAELELTREQLALSSKLRDSQTAYQQAREQSQKHRAQLSAVSHDLQQPLAALRIGLNDMKLRDEDTRHQMRAAFDFLEQLSIDQLSADRDDPHHAADSERSIEAFEISSVLDNVAAIFEIQANEKCIGFSYDRSTIRVQTDPVSLLRVVSNLVANAVNHAQHGEIHLSTSKRDEGIEVTVSDTGIGIAPRDIERLLQRHEKGADSGGSGLGLSLVQELSRDMGYRFDMQSTLGEGTRATLLIPKADPD